MVDAIASIRLYRDNDADIIAGNVPKHNGIGVLTDITDALVTEERQGAFLFTFSYAKPDESRADYWVQNMIFNGLKKNNVVKAKANEYDGEQLFRIDEVTLDAVTGNKEVNCVAIAQYDLALNTIIKAESKSNSLFAAMDMLLKNAIVPHKFKAWSDVSGASDYLAERKNVLNAISGSEGSIIDTWRADLQYDNFTVKAHANRGVNRGVQIAYTKNLTGLTETTSGQIYTRIVPFATVSVKDVLGNTDEEVITLKERYIDAPNVGHYPQPMSTSVDFSDKLKDEDNPDEAALRKVANEYFTETKCNLPSVAYEFSFVDLSKTEEYADYALLERISLFDIVTIRHSIYGIDIATDVIKYEYDPLNEWYERIYLGSERYSLDNQALDDKRENESIKDKVNGIPNYLNQAINDATNAITGNDGGNVVLYPPRQPQEIFIMDTDNVDTAKQVLRMNKSGIGFSSNGLNGPYGTAWTLDGKFVADYIATGTLDASKVKVFGGSATSYTSIVGNLVESRGQFTRTWRGDTMRHDVSLYMQNGYFRARNHTEGHSLYFSDFGISTYADGVGNEDASGTIAFRDHTYSTANSIMVHSNYGVVALRSENNRIVLDADATVNVESKNSSVYIRPMSSSIVGRNEFRFWVKNNTGASDTDGVLSYGSLTSGSNLGSGIRFDKSLSTSYVYATNNNGDIGSGDFYGRNLLGDLMAKIDNQYILVNNELRVTRKSGYVDDSSLQPIAASMLRSNSIRTMSGDFYLGVSTNELRVTNNLHWNGGSPAYKNVRASGFIEASSEKFKTDISEWEYDALRVLTEDTKIYSYRMKDDPSLVHRGLIVERDTPSEFIAGDGINTYEMNTWLLRAVQQLSERVIALEEVNNGE